LLQFVDLEVSQAEVSHNFVHESFLNRIVSSTNQSEPLNERFDFLHPVDRVLEQGCPLSISWLVSEQEVSGDAVLS
jgi:hypothetical protein